MNVQRLLRTTIGSRPVFVWIFFRLFCFGPHSFGATLTGVVHDQTGVVIPRVIGFLQAEDAPGQRFVARTDDQGVYRFQHVPGGRYKLELSRAGFLSKTIGSIAISSQEERSMPVVVLEVGAADYCGEGPLPLFDIRVIPAGTHTGNLAGTVTDEKGVPVPRAVVSLVCPNGQVCAATRTNVRGEFAFHKLEPGDYRVNVAHIRYYPESEHGLNVREDVEMVYSPIKVEACPYGNCDPKLRPKPETGDFVICI